MHAHLKSAGDIACKLARPCRSNRLIMSLKMQHSKFKTYKKMQHSSVINVHKKGRMHRKNTKRIIKITPSSQFRVNAQDANTGWSDLLEIANGLEATFPKRPLSFPLPPPNRQPPPPPSQIPVPSPLSLHHFAGPKHRRELGARVARPHAHSRRRKFPPLARDLPAPASRSCLTRIRNEFAGRWLWWW